MKKISLKNLNLKEVEQLSREQLKNVLGGYTNRTTVGKTCKCDTDCYVNSHNNNADCEKLCEGLTNENCYD